MTDAKNGKGGFKEFAKHEAEGKTGPGGLVTDAKTAPLTGPGAAKPDATPVLRFEKKLPTTPPGTAAV